MTDKYLIISPCRNEEKFMKATLDTVCRQSVLPDKWVIVDDGSTDDTPKILDEYAAKYPFISIVTRNNRGHRKVGGGVIDAFYSGLSSVDINEYEYICKLDLDLELPEKYFELIIKKMKDNPRIGNASGKPYYIDKNSGELVSEGCGDENAIGATKFYRVDCFKQIGGFVREVMWDGIDGHRCRMLGWIAVSWDEPDIRFIHLRPMGSSQKSILTGRRRHGFGQYFMGSSFIYMTIAAGYRMFFHHPFMLGGFAMWWGYVKSALTGVKRLRDKKFRKFLRAYQWNCLFKGKRRATQELNMNQEGCWDAGNPPSWTMDL